MAADKRPSLLFVMLVAVLAFSGRAFCEEEPVKQGLFNKLLAPGPLFAGHQDLEATGCLECHSPQKGVPDSKCLKCHKELVPNVENKSGFHGLTKNTCIECHSDHKGRTLDSTKVDEKKFDHKTTGYRLEGKHANLKCQECHVEKRATAKKNFRLQDVRFFGLKVSCQSCHKKDDVHKFQGKYAQKDCGECHGLKSWKTEVDFDHDEDTKFALLGKHEELKCALCHVPKTGAPIYQWPKLAVAGCLSCHKDQHGANLNAKFQNGKCNSCHNQTTWKLEKFNHAVTGYPLREKHAELKCVECHKQTKVAAQDLAHFMWKGLKRDCRSCHKDAHHFGVLSLKKVGDLNQCINCHTEGSWKRIHSFDHGRNTRFEIEGKHLGVDCIKCHVPMGGKGSTQKYVFKELALKTCETCHKSPHKNMRSKEFSRKCSDCHVADGWKLFKKGKTTFDHTKGTRFALTGKHQELSCSLCHQQDKKPIFKFESFDKQFCQDCHTNVHRGQFSPTQTDKSCAACHDTVSFKKLLPFNHSKTRFTLTGKHAETKCADCHKPTEEFFPGKELKPKSRFVFEGIPEEGFCTSCHENVHKGQFSSKAARRLCTDCHTTKNFRDRLPFDHNSTSFVLKDKHKDLKCAKCHIPTKVMYRAPSRNFKNKFNFPEIDLRDCNACHKDPHLGSMGGKCSECHVERGWKETRDFHKYFTLNGVHYSLDCVECHQGNRRLGGQSQNCALCHQKDDVHGGSLPFCTECHLQQFWEVTKFKHSMSNFPLRGVHRTLDCFDCHKGGLYKGLQSRCVDCHTADLALVTTPIHAMPAFESCGVCHNQFSFK